MNEDINTSQLEPWEPCNQCKIVKIDEGNEVQYTGTYDDKYLACEKCSEWTHPTCDNIKREDALNIDIYYCKKCRTRNRKITYKFLSPEKSYEKIETNDVLIIAHPNLEIHNIPDENKLEDPVNSKTQKQSNKTKANPGKKLTKKGQNETIDKLANNERTAQQTQQTDISNNQPTQKSIDQIQICSENHNHDDKTCQYQSLESPQKSDKQSKTNNPEKEDQDETSSLSEETESQYYSKIPAAQNQEQQSEDDSLTETLSQYLQQIPAAQEENPVHKLGNNTDEESMIIRTDESVIELPNKQFSPPKIQQSINTSKQLNNSAMELDDLINQNYDKLPKSLQEEISQIEKETTTPSTNGIEDITVSINQIPMPNDETSKPKLVANKQKIPK